MTNTLLEPNIVIIGGGFSGVMTAVNLIRQASSSFGLYLVEKTGNLAKGVAYSTQEAFHLLNVPGNNMGAFAEAPNHFMEWLIAYEALWRSQDKAFEVLPIEPGRYYPRKLYGFYLWHLFQTALQEAEAKNIKVTILTDEASNVDITKHRTAIVTLKHHILPEAQYVVIATGNAPVKSFAYAGGVFLCKDRYIEDIWSPDASNILMCKDLSHLPESTHIAIIGTGLTMVDAYASLHHKGYKGKVTAISRHGKLPHPHKSTQHYPAFLDVASAPQTSHGLFKTILLEVRRAAQNGHDWRSVLQVLRPITNELWANLPMKERRYIVERLLSYWNIHRHRVPDELHAMLEQSMASRQLAIIPGTIYYIGGKSTGPLMVSYRKRGEDFIEYTTADYVINCSGPETDIAKSGNPLLLKLRDKGIITVSTLRMGIELTPSGRAKGKAPDIFHAVGALLMGEKLESTAVPDIRKQAADTAARILSGRDDEDYSRYYNYFI